MESVGTVESISKRAKIALTFAGVALWAIVGFVVIYSTRLRPLADDYCHASTVATNGLVHAIEVWYLTWTGDFFVVSITALLVGVPLAELPLQLGSAVPFLLSAAAAVALVLVALGRMGERGTRRSFAVLLWLPALLVAWWSYWWIPATIDPDPVAPPAQLANALLNWQTVNVAYVFVPAVVIVAWLVLTRVDRPGVVLVPLMAVLGLIAGTSGLVFGAAAVAFVMLLEFLRVISSGRPSTRRLVSRLVFIAACVAGLASAYLSPGAQSRNQFLVDFRQPGSASPWGMFAWVFPEGVYTWLSGLIQAGALVVLLLAIPVAAISVRLGARIDKRRLLTFGGAFLAFSLVLTLAQRAGEAFSYPAFWHEVTARMLVFVAAVLFGTAAGAALAERTQTRVSIAVAGLAFATVFAVALGALFAMQAEIVARGAAWERGPAQSSFADIESDWVHNCWDLWRNERDLPDRGGY